MVNTRSLSLIVRNSSILSDPPLLVAMLFSVVLRSPFILFSQCQIIFKKTPSFKNLHSISRHTELEGFVKVDPKIVERQYNYSKTMKDQIMTHGRNALVAAILLGMILGGIIAWRTYKKQTIPIVLGVLIGGGTAVTIGGLPYLVLTSVARRGVYRWESLQERISKLKALDKIIDKKGEDLYPVAHILLDRIINKRTSVRDGSEALIEQCQEYQGTSS